MAFRHRALSRFATSDRGRRSQSNSYVCSTEDDAATVQAPGYFSGALERFGLKVGDVIDTTIAVAATPARLVLVVAGIAAGVVTTITGDAGMVFPPPAPSRTIPASVLLEGFESAAGFSTGSFALASDSVNKKEGASALALMHTLQSTGDAISTKALANIDAQNLGILTAVIYRDDTWSDTGPSVTLTKDTIAMSAGQMPSNDDNGIPMWRTLMLDTADVANKPAGSGAATLTVRNSGRQPSGVKAIFDSVYAHDEDMPSIIIRCDDGYAQMMNDGGAYAKSKGFPLNFFVPVDGASRASWATIKNAHDAGHGVSLNFTSKDDGPTAAGTRQNFVNDALYGKNTLLAQGIRPDMLGIGVFSNGASELNANYPITRFTDAVYDGNGGVTVTVGANAPAVGMIFKGWDATLSQFVSTTITAVASTTSFTTAYKFPVNTGLTGTPLTISKRAAYRLDGEFLDRKLATDLKAAGFKNGLLVSLPTDTKLSTKRGLNDFLVPCNGFTSSTTLAPFQALMEEVQKYGCSRIWYLHTWVDDGTAPGIGHNAALLKQVFDMLGAQQAAGNLWVPRVDKWMQRMGMSAAFGA